MTPQNVRKSTRRHLFPFFELPRELRDEIYQHMQEPARIEWWMQQWQYVKTWFANPKDGLIVLTVRGMRPPVNMRLSCRRIRTEIWSRQVKDMELVVAAPAMDVSAIVDSLVVPDRRWTLQLTRLTVRIYVDQEQYIMSRRVGHPGWVRHLIDYMPNLISVRVDIKDVQIPTPLARYDQVKDDILPWTRLKFLRELYMFDYHAESDWEDNSIPTLQWNSAAGCLERVSYPSVDQVVARWKTRKYGDYPQR